MPAPPFVTLPEGVRRVWVETERGAFAALSASADSAPSEPPPSGRTALLVPGFTGSKENFIAVLRPLADAGHRVVAVDMRGQYETPGPDDPDAYTVPALGADIAAIVTALESGLVHLVGHSFGGLVAREVALTSAELLASLSLFDTGPAALTGPRAEHTRQLVSALSAMDRETIWETMEARNAGDPVQAQRSADVIDYQRRRFFESTAAGMIAMGDAMLTESDKVDELARAAAGLPVFCVYGESDNAWSPDAQAVMTHRLGARHTVIPGAEHSPAAEAPDATARAFLDFWADAEKGELAGA